MLSRAVKILLFGSVVFYSLHLLFFWIYETTDSYFYWAFAQFLANGKYFMPHPYYWILPSTIEPPLYSVFIYLIRAVPRADIVVHLLHIIWLFAGAYFIFLILENYINQEKAAIVSLLFILVPSHIFQISSFMPEVAGLFLNALFLLTAFLILEKKKSRLSGLLLFLSAVMVLLKYSFIFYFILSLLLFLGVNKKKTDYFFCFLGIGIIAGWILINHQLTGSWGLSDSQGKHLYNRVVFENKLTPPENDPNLTKLKNLSEGGDVYQPVWVVEPTIFPKLGSSLRKENKLLGDVALAGIFNHPSEFIFHTLSNFLKVHANGQNFSIRLYTTDPLWGKCRNLGNFDFCSPIIKNQQGEIMWNAILKLSENYYAYMPVFTNFLLFLPSLVFAFFQKNKFIKICALSYLVSVIFALMVEIPEMRYQYVFYPTKVILATYFLSVIFKRIKLFSSSR